MPLVSHPNRIREVFAGIRGGRGVARKDPSAFLNQSLLHSPSNQVLFFLPIPHYISLIFSVATPEIPACETRALQNKQKY